MSKIICISDTHTKANKLELPDGDILIHAGDHTFRGDLHEVVVSLRHLAEIGKDFEHIVTICGNHDWLGEHQPSLMKSLCEDQGIIYLDHSAVEIDGIKFFGSAYSPEFCNWAFAYDRADGKEKWATIPDDTQVLITHGPPQLMLDKCPSGEVVGCFDLMKRIAELNDLRLHVFGHIHHSYGTAKRDNKLFVNASICTERYEPYNPPISVYYSDTHCEVV